MWVLCCQCPRFRGPISIDLIDKALLWAFHPSSFTLWRKRLRVQEGSDLLPQLDLWSIFSGLKFSILYGSGLLWRTWAKDLCWKSKIVNQWKDSSLVGILYYVLAKSLGVCNSTACCLSNRWAFGCKRHGPHHDFSDFLWLRLWDKRTLPGPTGVHTQTQRPEGEKPKLHMVRIVGRREWLLQEEDMVSRQANSTDTWQTLSWLLLK